MVVLCGWFVAGLYVDGWAHHHGAVDNSFFTPWHALLYSGFGAATTLLALMFFRDGRSLPAGYGLSLLGGAIFLGGGVADMVWHILFGIEESVEALYSPSHLVLAIGMSFVVSGPFRAAWRRPDGTSRVTLVPMLLSLTFTLSVLTFFTQVVHPFVRPRAAGVAPASELNIFFLQALGVGGVIVQTALLMGFVLLALRRWTLPAGSLTLIIGLNAAAMTVFSDEYWLILPAVLAGVGADALRVLLRPSVARPWRLRGFAAAVPMLFYLLYFLTLMSTRGVWWSTHLWTGSVVLGGIAGWLLSYLLVPMEAAA